MFGLKFSDFVFLLVWFSFVQVQCCLFIWFWVGFFLKFFFEGVKLFCLNLTYLLAILLPISAKLIFSYS